MIRIITSVCPIYQGGNCGRAMVLGNFQSLLIWVTVWPRPIVLAVFVGGGDLKVFSFVYVFSFFLPFSRRRQDID